MYLQVDSSGVWIHVGEKRENEMDSTLIPHQTLRLLGISLLEQTGLQLILSILNVIQTWPQSQSTQLETAL